MKITKWYLRIQSGVNMGYCKNHSTQVELVLKNLTDPISPQYHVVFDDILYTVVIITTSDLEVFIILVTPRNSSIQVMLD